MIRDLFKAIACLFGKYSRHEPDGHTPPYSWPRAWQKPKPSGKKRSGNVDPIAMALLELLGCPKNVRRLKYVVAVNEVSTVTVEYLPDIADDAGVKLKPILKMFELKEILPWPHPPLPEHDGQTRMDLQEAALKIQREGRQLS